MHKLGLIVLAAALLACSDDKDKSGTASDNVTDASKPDSGKTPDKASQLDRPGELPRPPSDGRVPAELRPPGASTTAKKDSP